MEFSLIYATVVSLFISGCPIGLSPINLVLIEAALVQNQHDIRTQNRIVAWS